MNVLTNADWKMAHGIIRGPHVPQSMTREVYYLLTKSITFLDLVPMDRLGSAEAYRRQGARLIGRIGSLRGGVYTSRMVARPKLP